MTTTTLTSRRTEAVGVGPEMAALLLGAWAVGALAVGIISLHRRDP